MRGRNQYGNNQETDLGAIVFLAFWGIFCIVVFDAAIGFRARRVGATERSRDESRERPRNEPRDRPGNLGKISTERIRSFATEIPIWNAKINTKRLR